MGIWDAGEDDVTRIMREVEALDDDLTPSQRGIMWTARVWLGLIEPVATVASVAAAIAAMVVIITSVGSAAVGFVVYFACAISGAIGIRFTLRRIRRALFSRLVTTLREKQNAIAGFGGTTSAVLPALTARDDGGRAAVGR